MESLHRKYKDKGLRILAFPANNFGNQEPGTNEEIKTFCRTKYDVTFDVFAKISVGGKDQCDLYKYLTDPKADHGFGGKVRWNFQKYVVDRKGKLIGKFEPRVAPDDDRIVKLIEKALGQDAGDG